MFFKLFTIKSKKMNFDFSKILANSKEISYLMDYMNCFVSQMSIKAYILGVLKISP